MQAVSEAIGQSLYSEHMKLLGIKASIDELAIEVDRVRLHLAIENTGEKKEVSFNLDNNRLYVLDKGAADTWRRGFAWLQKRGEAQESLVGHPDVITLHAEDPRQFPVVLQPGERWEGWLGSFNRPLPPTTAAVIGQFGPIVPKKLGIPMEFYTFQNGQAFIGLTEPSTVDRLSLHGGVTAAAARQARVFALILPPFLGLVIGTVSASLVLSSLWEPLFLPASVGGGALGLVLGWRAGRALYMRRFSRKF